MVKLQIYNTESRGKVPFEPQDPQDVRMYVCGPTVYNYVHIGNARPVVVFDILFRLLREIYGVDQVTYARNITDIEDKIMATADAEGVPIEVITKRYTEAYEREMLEMGALQPTLTPRATEHLPEMIGMTQTLIDQGHAYEADGHVMFHVPSMPNYGRLSRHGRDELVAGARVEVAPYKRDAADFVLWKPSQEDQVGWDSPWGRGRPGWHLECSCMIEKHLGTTIDIHAGGQDLIFPHHENEIAQSECAHGETFVKYWMHNGYLTVDGEKMSKSLGNFHTVHDLLKEHPGEALRLSLLTAHYRQPVDFSLETVAEQKRRLDRWYRLTADIKPSKSVPQIVLEALADDINTPKAIAALDGLAKEGDAAGLLAGAQFMGFLMHDPNDWFQSGKDGDLSADHIEALIRKRADAKASKDYAGADAVRDQLAELGVVLEDGPGGTTWRRMS